ncbi:MAG: hypothetical protein KF727_15005 [Microbacteriaceae bacterium]|nr:hypothetical protein [Microbacteriaceae bacterium]
MLQRLSTAATAAGLSLLLVGCVPTAPDPTPTIAPTTDNPLPSTAPTRPIDAGEVTPAPEAAGTSQQDAIAAATKVMETFARPQLSAEEWWRAMLPLLSQQGAHAYEGTDPAEIPVTAVTGPGQVLEASTEVLLIVQLPTDAGLYNITLTRSDASSPWLAERIRPAQP